MARSKPELKLAATASERGRANAWLSTREQAETLLQQQGLAALRDALESCGANPISGWHAFWLGYAAQFDDLAEARNHWIAAEQQFRREGDVAGIDLAACGLVQCVLIDQQSYEGLDDWAERVAALGNGADERTPLGLFQCSAQVLVASERRESVDVVQREVDAVFRALGGTLDAELRLRAATAMLPMLGLALDRAQAEDFYQAGAAVEQLPGVGDYSRALWHLFVVESRFFDATWTERLHAELDRVERFGQAASASVLIARAHLLRAALALGAGDAARGHASLEAAHPALEPGHPRDYWVYHYYRSRHALLVGDAEEAWSHIRLTARKLAEARVPPARATAAVMQEGFVLVALGRFDDAAAAFARAAGDSRGAQATPCHCHVHLTRALQLLETGALDEARAELAAGFAHARSIDLTHFFRALPRTAAELCGAALELDADPAFARRAVVARSLLCPDRGITRWPWPVRIRALGAFTIERDGEPVRFGRKAPKRLLDLLRAVVALGGRQVDAARVAGLLWPDAAGGEEREALKAIVHRVRVALGADVLVVRDGLLSLDERAVWLDTTAFDHVAGRIEALLVAGTALPRGGEGELERRRRQLFALYRGHFLGEGEIPSWALPLRDRLRARHVRAVELLGRWLEQRGRQDDAIALYRAALEHDNLAEELYQRLIECHLTRGETAQALNAYRRCRELLSIVLGLKPSARTQSLVARWTNG